jgi:hypothetical protein
MQTQKTVIMEGKYVGVTDKLSAKVPVKGTAQD